ncbi:uncharacterized protein [Macrobrachium rosenbergii]|uniref:uncharacterized protein n=1 Tax=Macrobrachium rosenbergii TaxID=79674 RepID=UPI0034D6FF47
MSKEFRDSLASHGITHHYSTPYHPESQGIIERFHQTLRSPLSILAEENGASWEENLPYALRYSPFELLFAHSTQAPLEVLYEAWADPERAAWVDNLPSLQQNLQAAWAIAQAHEAATQQRATLQADTDARTSSFEVGNQVLILHLGAS